MIEQYKHTKKFNHFFCIIYTISLNIFPNPFIELGQKNQIPISLIVVSQKGQTFTYLQNELYRNKLIDLNQIRDIEHIYLINEDNYKQIKKNKSKLIEEHHIKSFAIPNPATNFLQSITAFMDSKNFNKQIIGFKKDDDKIILYATNKHSTFVEATLNKSIKKTLIWIRAGQKINIPLKTKFISFSKRNLPKKKLNGVFGLLTKQGQRKIEKHLNLKQLNIAQATFTGTVNQSLLGAKGTIGIPASPAQIAILKNNNEFDLILNLDEFHSFKNGKLPNHNQIVELKENRISLLKIIQPHKAKISKFPIIHLLNLLNNQELINEYLKVWKSQIDSQIKKYNQKVITKSQFKKELISLTYFCKLPQHTRYLWADESLDINQITVPESLKHEFPIGQNVVILSHPLLFDLNYAVLTIKGYNNNESFTLNPELCDKILRDQDGDTLSIVSPKILKLKNIHIPKNSYITTKRDIKNEPLCNELMIKLLFYNNKGINFTISSIIDLYIHMLENNKHRLCNKYKLTLARFYQASLDRKKKSIDPMFFSGNLDKLLKSLYSKIYDSQIDDKQLHSGFSIPQNPIFSKLKTLKKTIKKGGVLKKIDSIKEIISEPTNIKLLDDVWNDVYNAMNLVD